MEVVILGEAGLKLFLGSINVDALKKFVEDRLDITALCDSLLPKFTVPLPHRKPKGTCLNSLHAYTSQMLMTQKLLKLLRNLVVFFHHFLLPLN
jgi:hypothetical protein